MSNIKLKIFETKKMRMFFWILKKGQKKDKKRTKKGQKKDKKGQKKDKDLKK